MTVRSPRWGPVSARPAAASRPRAGGQGGGQPRLDLLGPLAAGRQLLPLSGQGEPGPGKGAIGARLDLGLQGVQRPRPGPRHQCARLRHARLQRGEPGGVGGTVHQQPGAFAQGLVVGGGVGWRGRARRRTPGGRRTGGARRRPPGTAGPGPASARPGGGVRRGVPAAGSRRRCRTARRAAAGSPVPDAHLALAAVEFAATAHGRPCASPGERRPTSAKAAARRPRPGEKKLIASRRLVLPAPLGPTRNALRPPSASAAPA